MFQLGDGKTARFTCFSEIEIDFQTRIAARACDRRLYLRILIPMQRAQVATFQRATFLEALSEEFA